MYFYFQFSVAFTVAQTQYSKLWFENRYNALKQYYHLTLFQITIQLPMPQSKSFNHQYAFSKYFFLSLVKV